MQTGRGCNLTSVAVLGLAVIGAAIGGSRWGWLGLVVGAVVVPLGAFACVYGAAHLAEARRRRQRS